MTMRKTLLLAAFLAAATPAVAQQFPTSFPANTVYGRLGFSAGPGQAIPIGSLTDWALNVNGADIYNTNTGNVGIGVGSSTAAGDKLDVVGSITTRRTLATDIGGTFKIGHGAYQWQLLGNQIAAGDLLLKNPGGTTVLAMPQTGGCLGVATGATLPTCGWALDVGSGTGNAGIRINGGGFVAGQGPVLTFQRAGLDVGQLGTDCYLVSSPCNTDLVMLGLNSSRMFHFYQWGGVNVSNTATMNPTVYGAGAFNVRTVNSNNLVGGNGIWVQSTDDTNVRNLPVAIAGHMIALQAGNSDWVGYYHCDVRVAAECASFEATSGNTNGTPNDPPAASASTPTMPFNSALKMTCGLTLSDSAATHYPCSVGLWGKYYLGNGGQQFRTGIWLDEGFASNTGILVNATAAQSATTSAEFRNSGSGKALVLKTLGAGVSTNHAFEIQDSGGSAVFWVNNAGAIEVDNGGIIQAITNFSLRNAGTGAFNLRLLPNTTMTGNRTLNIAMDADRTLTLAGNINVGGGFLTSGSLTLPVVAQGDVWYGSAADTISALAKNTSATRYLSNTGTSNNPAWAQVNLTNGVTGTLPTANGGTGVTGLTFQSITATVPATIAASGTASSVTGTTGETTLATITLPANAMGANGTCRITILMTYTGTAGTHQTRVKFGGTTYYDSTAIGGVSYLGGRHQIEITNLNATNSQAGAAYANFSSQANAPTTSAIDTTSSVAITITAQLGNAADTGTLTAYRVEVMR